MYLPGFAAPVLLGPYLMLLGWSITGIKLWTLANPKLTSCELPLLLVRETFRGAFLSEWRHLLCALVVSAGLNLQHSPDPDCAFHYVRLKRKGRICMVPRYAWTRSELPLRLPSITCPSGIPTTGPQPLIGQNNYLLFFCDFLMSSFFLWITSVSMMEYDIYSTLKITIFLDSSK